MGLQSIEGRFSGDAFVVQSPLIGTDYTIKSASGSELFRAERRFFADDFTYVYSDDTGEELFRYELEGEDERNRYRLVYTQTDQHVATLSQSDERDRFHWRLHTESEGTVVHITGQAGSVPVLDPQRGRHMSITDADGQSVGQVDRRLLALHFTFDVDLRGLTNAAKLSTLLAVPLLYDAMRQQPTDWDG